MSLSKPLVVTVGVLMVAACASPQAADRTDPEVDRQAVLAALDSMIVGASGPDGRTDAFLAFYEDSAVWMSPNSNTDLTKATIRPFYDALLDRFAFTDLAGERDEIILMGDWALVRVSFTGMLVPRDGSAPFPLGGDRHTMLFRRQPDRSWRIARDMWNNPPTNP